MWPWGHAAVGYLLCSLWIRSRYDRRPTAGIVLPLAVGTQFPDLVDKPLAWTFGVLPSGRAGAHSLLVAVPLLALLWWRVDGTTARRAWAGFAVGYLVHLATDGVYALLEGDVSGLTYLFWPALSLPSYAESPGILAHFLAADITPYLLAELLLFAAATLLWAVDGAPGLRAVGRWCKRRADGATTG
ncbi:metal-dependent hydrolase [Haloarcula salinisoli]|uniref:Metal-dependent hydrolase n=1 Tax=Haloarcula salinisoli TaxID=2487746 RepID=A0A8J7YF69_9EURY|nr:metal-dependent hydrolase [Halomicroarcula salinisoli]MBX0287832.1 metal-dependent hydrolase [Halomicroarcula salinisoli]MBX0304775.1 metal-dependent hydrolase [Halomicroarcula salinisoli]